MTSKSSGLEDCWAICSGGYGRMKLKLDGIKKVLSKSLDLNFLYLIIVQLIIRCPGSGRLGRGCFEEAVEMAGQ